MAEGEQVDADRGAHGVRLAVRLDPAQRRAFRVGKPKFVAVGGETGRLREERFADVAVSQAFDGRAGETPDRAGDRVEHAQRVVARHRDHDAAGRTPPLDVPWAGQVDLEPLAGIGAVAPLVAGTGDRGHLAGDQVEAAQPVTGGVGDDGVIARTLGDVVRQQRDSGRLGEARDVERPVLPASLATAEAANDRLAVRGELDDGVVSGVGNENAAFGGRDGLAGEAQLGLLLLHGHVRTAATTKRPLRFVLRHEIGDDAAKCFSVPFAGGDVHDVALGVDHDQRRPGAHGVLGPGDHLRVVEHRVVDLIAADGGLDRRGLALVQELRRVDTHRDQEVGEFLLHRPQLVQDVQAVDATAGPEVEQDDASAQLGEGDSAATGVEPDIADEFGRAHAGLRSI